MLLPLLLNLNQFNTADTHDGKGIYYQDQPKKKRRRRRHELFAAIESSIRAAVLGEPERPVALAVAATDIPAVSPRAYQDALTQLVTLASDYADLSARLDRLQHDLSAYATQRREHDEEDDILMLL